MLFKFIYKVYKKFEKTNHDYDEKIMKNFYINILKELIVKKNIYQNYDFGGYEFKLNSIQKKLNKCFFSGYASIFNVVDRQNDIILPGAFKKTILETKKIILLWQHDHSQPIGKITNLNEDENGLQISGELILDISKANDIYHMLKHGILESFSIGYTPIKFSYKSDNNLESEVRVIKELKLWEISLVTFPANNFAKIGNLRHPESFDSDESYDYEQLYNYVFNETCAQENEKQKFKKIESEEMKNLQQIKEMIKKLNSNL
jgi:HK97 family phage prohead protease